MIDRLIKKLEDRSVEMFVKPMTFDSEQERLDIIAEHERIGLPDIEFPFSYDHFGYKGGRNHVILSQTGKGKSTFGRTILFKALKEYKVFWYSTEEDYDDFRAYSAKSNIPNSLLRNLFFFKEKEELSFIDVLNRVVVENGCDLVVLDNSTTCKEMTRLKQDGQIALFKKIRNTLSSLSLPMITIAHTSSEIKGVSMDRLDPQNIRGFKDIVLEAEVIYTLETIIFEIETNHFKEIDEDGNKITFTEEKKETIISIAKSRYGGSDKSYIVKYDESLKLYNKCQEITGARYISMKKMAVLFSRGLTKDKKKKK